MPQASPMSWLILSIMPMTMMLLLNSKSSMLTYKWKKENSMSMKKMMMWPW